jgi:hypothetical protein
VRVRLVMTMTDEQIVMEYSDEGVGENEASLRADIYELFVEVASIFKMAERAEAKVNE